ncbi:MAG: 50S ribosome-binding protein YggL [Neisseria sp.]|nr:50S ribosome-binding protein YggL [Neisseria sp.]
MNPRQRKKLHLGEFKCLVFGVRGQFQTACQSEAASLQFTDELIDYVERQSMRLYGANSHQDFSFHFETEKPLSESATAEKRRLLLEWLTARNEIQHLQASGLFDGFYADAAVYEQYDETCK